jgi:hypothetical protein
MAWKKVNYTWIFRVTVKEAIYENTDYTVTKKTV